MRQDAGVDGDAQRLSQLCWMFFLKIIDDQNLRFQKVAEIQHYQIPPDTAPATIVSGITSHSDHIKGLMAKLPYPCFSVTTHFNLAGCVRQSYETVHLEATIIMLHCQP